MSTPEASIAIFPPLLDENAFINQRIYTKSRLSRRMKRVLLFVLVCILLLSSSVVGFYTYMLYRLQKPEIPALLSNPMQAAGLLYHDISFPSVTEDRLLEGWYIPGSTRNTVILSHGYASNREEPWVPLYQIAKELNKNRFNVVMFDYGFTQPDGYVTGGIKESEELLGAIRFVKELGDEQVYIWGFSMGAGTALQSALKDASDIDGMILDSTFILDSDTVFHNVKQKVKNLPRTPSIYLLNALSPIFTGHSLKEVPQTAMLETEYEMPLFMVHGERDKVAPVWSITSFYEAQRDQSNIELWLIPNGKHELIYKYHKQEYMQRAMKFLYNCVHLAGSKSPYVTI